LTHLELTINYGFPVFWPVEYLQIVLEGVRLVFHKIQFNSSLGGCLNQRIDTTLLMMNMDSIFESIGGPVVE
jgi:hypothetical protein